MHGRSRSLQARLRLSRRVDGIVLEQLEATVPVQSLDTGMKLRDKHMRTSVFTDSDGERPDIQFRAERSVCTASGRGGKANCRLNGDLAIRGTFRPFVIELTVTERGNTLLVSGDAIVKLSSYGIEPPSQFGVKTSDEVKLHVDVVAKSFETFASAGAQTGR